uniref:ENTH domain-containing protein n=1 Tax=Lotharella globosa TaxID=91324 RepID=A0A6U3EVA3_9EUKA|mmetsp:Transcript_8883/g.17281  ORF Transcript_8883/g.17281 Transcript_8883/m.17281 type:complete len:169 (-) Transcript_8883:176-682(-)
MTSLSPVHWFEYLAAPTHLKIPGKPWKRRETSVEAMVEEATSSSEYRPHHELVKALALATEESKNCKRVLSKLCKVVDDVKEVIRVQKAVLILHYLLFYGSDEFIAYMSKQGGSTLTKAKYFRVRSGNIDELTREAELRSSAGDMVALISDIRILNQVRGDSRSKLKE